MWEAIAQNKRRSWVLIGAMGLLLVGLGVCHRRGRSFAVRRGFIHRKLITQSYESVYDPDNIQGAATLVENRGSPTGYRP